MRIETKYICEICGTSWTDEDAALRCEARGLESADERPVGMIYGNHTTTGFYNEITFAVASQHRNTFFDKHRMEITAWACRDNQYGDSLGKSHCEGNQSLNEDDTWIDINAPHFKRMVAWLESQNISITVWDGFKPVPLADWLKLPKLPATSFRKTN